MSDYAEKRLVAKAELLAGVECVLEAAPAPAACRLAAGAGDRIMAAGTIAEAAAEAKLVLDAGVWLLSMLPAGAVRLEAALIGLKERLQNVAQHIEPLAELKLHWEGCLYNFDGRCGGRSCAEHKRSALERGLRELPPR